MSVVGTGMSEPRRRPFASKRRRKWRHSLAESTSPPPRRASRRRATRRRLERSPFVRPPASASAIGAKVIASRIETFGLLEADRHRRRRDRSQLLWVACRRPAAFGGQAQIRSIAAQLSVVARRIREPSGAKARP